jgi:hypothetical protein
MKAFEGMNVYFQVFLTSALVRGEWLASRSVRFTPGEISPRCNRIGGWVDHRTDLDEVENRKFLTLPGLEILPSVAQPLASCYCSWFILLLLPNDFAIF